MKLSAKLVVDYYLGGLLHALLKPPTVVLGKLLRRDHDLTKCSSITIIKMLGGGSLVIAYPALLAIKNAPGVAKLRLLTTPGVKQFAESLGLFDEILIIRDDSAFRFLIDSLATIRKLFRCDAIVDLEVHSRLTTVFAVITCARNRVGFYTRDSFWRQQLATHLLFCNFVNGLHFFYDQIAVLFGGVPDLALSRSRFRAAMAAPAAPADSPRLRIALAPCCSDLAKERVLLPEEWVRILTRRLRRADVPEHTEIHLLGAPGDRGELDRLAELLRAAFPQTPAVNHAGISLGESIRQIAGVSELFGIDSALLHFARLLGVPTVSFWGPTDPGAVLRRWPGNRDEIHYRKLPCSPCAHLAQEAPCQGNNICMRLAVDPDWECDVNPAWIVADDSAVRFSRLIDP